MHGERAKFDVQPTCDIGGSPMFHNIARRLRPRNEHPRARPKVAAIPSCHATVMISGETGRKPGNDGRFGDDVPENQAVTRRSSLESNM